MDARQTVQSILAEKTCVREELIHFLQTKRQRTMSISFKQELAVFISIHACHFKCQLHSTVATEKLATYPLSLKSFFTPINLEILNQVSLLPANGCKYITGALPESKENPGRETERKRIMPSMKGINTE